MERARKGARCPRGSLNVCKSLAQETWGCRLLRDNAVKIKPDSMCWATGPLAIDLYLGPYDRPQQTTR